MKKIILIFAVLISLYSCKKEDINTTQQTHYLTFTVSPSANIWWGVGEIQYNYKSGGYYDNSLTIKSGETFYIRIESPPIPPTRKIVISIDGEIVYNENSNGYTIKYYIK